MNHISCASFESKVFNTYIPTRTQYTVTMNLQCHADHCQPRALPRVTLLPRYYESLQPMLQRITQRPNSGGPGNSTSCGKQRLPEENRQALTVTHSQIRRCEASPSKLVLSSAFLPCREVVHHESRVLLRMRTEDLDEVSTPYEDQQDISKGTKQVNDSLLPTLRPRKKRRTGAYPLKGGLPILLTPTVVPSTGNHFRIVDATPATPAPSADSTGGAISLSPPSLNVHHHHDADTPDRDYYFATDAIMESENFPDEILLPIF